jgi:hypothetical protein
VGGNNIVEQTPGIEKESKDKSALPLKKLKKQAATEELAEPAPAIKQRKGPDSYREPIE